MGFLGKALNVIFAVPIFLIVVGAQFTLIIFDSLIPKRLQELIPLLDMQRTLLVQVSLMFTDAEKRAAQQALMELEGVAEQVDEVVHGYAIRKGVGQSVDVAVSAIAITSLGLIQVFQHSANPALMFYLFSTASMALSTFAGLFGPPYALWEECKEFALRKGNYRGASIYQTLESIMALPFISSAAGFLLLDVPPVDQETLEDFKKEVGEQLEEVQEKLANLIGTDKAAVQKKTLKTISELMEKNEETLSSLDFRKLRAEKAREFALNYFQREFPLMPWKRKKALKKFAEQHHFTEEEAERTLRLIANKIMMGQEDEDLINNIMITGALKGIIEKEQEYRESFEDLELGKLATGLAFGARQFLQDHYLSITFKDRLLDNLRGFFIFLVAQPYVIVNSIVQYANYFYDYWVDFFATNRGVNLFSILKERYIEISEQLAMLPKKIKSKLSRKKKEETPETKAEDQSNDKKPVPKGNFFFRLGRWSKKAAVAFWSFILLPFKVGAKIVKWTILKLQGKSIDARVKMASEISDAALVSMYNELFQRLVLQSHVSSAF